MLTEVSEEKESVLKDCFSGKHVHVGFSLVHVLGAITL
jgi:hypothetical protein